MKSNLKHLTRRTALVLAMAALPAFVHAQKAAPATDPWPTRTVKILVGFPGGSSPDLVARALAEPLSQKLGQPVIVENRPGAAGNIAADLVSKATDGHTIGVMINGNLTTAKILNPKTPYDPATDLAPLSLIGTAPLVLTAPANAPGATAQAFLADARKEGGKWSYGLPGVGTVGNIGMEMLKARTGIDPLHIPYPGNPQVIAALISGQIQMALLPPGLAAAQVRGGKLRAIGVTSTGRSSLVPEMPSLAEAGVTNLQLEIWTAAAAPIKMPKAHQARLSAAISEIVRTPEMREKLFQQGWQMAGTSPEGLANRMKSDTAAMGAVIVKQGLASH